MHLNFHKFVNDDLGILTRLIVAFGEITLPEDSTILESFYKGIIKPNILKFDPDDLCAIIYIYSDKYQKQPSYFREMIKGVNAN